jgi:hypothetical protein
MSRPARRFKLDSAAVEILSVLIDAKLQSHADLWKKEVSGGEIGSEARAVFVAMGWVTERDGRLTPVEPAKPKAGAA